MKKIILIFLFLSACGLVAWYCSPYRTLIPGIRKSNLTPDRYALEKDTVLSLRQKLAAEFSRVSGIERDKLIIRAGTIFGERLNEHLFEYWYGTDWDFNGTSQVPGQGSIACGYFVTTLLRDMGVKLDRVKEACGASEVMIKSLTDEKWIRRFSNYTIEKFVAEIKKMGDGIYLTGLDNHTGFVVCSQGKVDFVHSGGGAPAQVLREDALTSGLLKASHYRVTGKITADQQFLSKWIKGESF